MARRPRTVTVDQRIRELHKELGTLGAQPSSPERTAALALLTREAHATRQVNLAMQAAALCLDDPEGAAALVDTYLDEDDHEARLEALTDLRDLARYIDRPDIGETAQRHLTEVARSWVSDATPGERRYRLRTVQSLTSRELADRLRDELDATG